MFTKTGMFSWVALQKRIMTTNWFRKLGFEGPSRCILCEAKEETVNHLLMKYPHTSRCWNWLCRKLDWKIALSNNLMDTLKSWPNICKNSLYKLIWRITLSILVCEVCKERSRRIFQSKKMEVKNLFNKTETVIIEMTNNRQK